jgi:hypothetical protein
MRNINQTAKLSHFVPIMQKLASLSKFMNVTGEFRDLLQNIDKRMQTAFATVTPPETF